jgi:hypothetical protein
MMDPDTRDLLERCALALAEHVDYSRETPDSGWRGNAEAGLVDEILEALGMYRPHAVDELRVKHAEHKNKGGRDG